jgi:phosphonate transport system substrate-binding protein
MQRPSSGHVMISYDELESGARRDEFHLLWLPPLIAVSLLSGEVAAVLAVPVRGGETSYATALFTRPGSELRRIGDLRGKTAAWVSEHSAAGCLLPRALLRAHGIDPSVELGQQHMLGTHAKVVDAVLAGDVDFGATYVNLKNDTIVDAGWGTRDTRVLGHYGPIPADVLTAGRTLDETARARITQLLLHDRDSDVAQCCAELMRCDDFAAPDPVHLEALRKLASPPSIIAT